MCVSGTGAGEQRSGVRNIPCTMASPGRAPCPGTEISELHNRVWTWQKATSVSKMSVNLICFFLCALIAPSLTGKWLKLLQLAEVWSQRGCEKQSFVLSLNVPLQNLNRIVWGQVILTFDSLSKINTGISKWKRQSINSMFCKSILKSK